MFPPTRNMQVLGPLASTQARSDPFPESFRFETSITTPPRPPTDAAPPPSAPGNAGQFEPLHDALEDGLGGLDGFDGAVTATVAMADLPESALLVAVTVSVPAFDGALYVPDDVIVPKTADHATDLSVTVPCTLAVNCSEPLVPIVVEAGEIVIAFTTGVAAAVVTVTLADADLVASAALVAVTVTV